MLKIYEYKNMIQNKYKTTHISEMKNGYNFIASDGKIYRVVKTVKTIRFYGGVCEYDMYAECIDENQIYLFHAPVGATKQKVSYVVI